MFLLDFAAAALIAFVISIAVIYGFRRRGPAGWGGFVFFFLLFLVITWAGGLWIGPFGIPGMGGLWLTYLFVGVVAGLLLLALTRPANLPPKAEQQSAVAQEAVLAFSLAYWAVILLLVAMVAAHYAMPVFAEPGAGGPASEEAVDFETEVTE